MLFSEKLKIIGEGLIGIAFGVLLWALCYVGYFIFKCIMIIIHNFQGVFS